MRYAIVTETYPPEINGVALTVQGLEHGLRQRGHAVEVFRPRQPHEAAADSPQLTRSALLPCYPGLRVGLPSTAQLAQQWQACRPDAVYIATEGPLGWSALRLARRMGIAVATGLHTRFDHYLASYGAGWLQPAALGWMRHFHNQADATLVPTTELRDFLQTNGFTRVRLLSRGVDSQQFSPHQRDPALREDWGLGEHGFAVIHVGRIAAEKNLPLAVHAYRQIQKHRPRARFVWVGDGPQRAALEHANPDFIFCGNQHEAALARHIASADLFVFPSRSETFGNVTLEAMASGVATVAFDQGAARAHLVHGQHGALANDEDGFTAAAVRLACDDDMRAALGSNASVAMQRLNPAHVVAHLDALLQQLAAQHAHATVAA